METHRGRLIDHLHLKVRDLEASKRFYKTAMEALGDNGAPGERNYHPGYYAAFAFDPDGNNVEAVHHGPNKRSADSVHISW